MEKIDADKFEEIAFPLIGVDDSVNRIFFEAGEFNLDEYIIHSYANSQFID